MRSSLSALAAGASAGASPLQAPVALPHITHEAVRLSGAVGEGPLRTPAYLRGRRVTFLTVGAGLRVGLLYAIGLRAARAA